jgi:energy-converting hydrogenase B subunit Q
VSQQVSTTKGVSFRAIAPFAVQRERRFDGRPSAQVAQVAQGAITEADRHNIRGERISVDTIPLVGEKELAEAVSGVGRLPRIGALVLAGSLMGGIITDSIEEIQKEHDVIVISLNMLGSVTDKADLVITDPVQAGVMAVMAVADTATFDIKKIGRKKF